MGKAAIQGVFIFRGAAGGMGNYPINRNEKSAVRK